MKVKMRHTAGLLTRHWYALAQSHQVTTKTPIQRMLMDEPIVLWRRATDGVVVALRDRCLHRNAGHDAIRR